MNFTGTNTLYTPLVPQINYLFRNIMVNSTGVYSVTTTQYLPFASVGNTSYLFQLSGNQISDSSGRFVSTYNTDESFSLSGWINYPNGNRYLTINSMVFNTVEPNISALLGQFTISCPTGGFLKCDLIIQSSPIQTSLSFNNLSVNGSTVGTMNTDTCMYMYNDSMFFYQSFESLLTGTPVMAFLDSRFPSSLVYYDNNTAFYDDGVSFNYYFDTTYANVDIPFVIGRTGLYNSGFYLLTDLTTNSGIFSGLFNGSWSGSGFYYQDTPSTTVFNYQVSLADNAGNTYPMTVNYGLNVIGISSGNLPANYITGFQLITGGEYLTPPNVSVTGYYFSTGIQQNLQTLLFSSGCTGNLLVTFSGLNGVGTGASGLLMLTPVTLSGIYAAGLQQFNLVSQYVSLNYGTGYTVSPLAQVQTGIYSSACYDVPNTQGYSYSWFSPFNTYGATIGEAGWFSGISLCTTGLVSGGMLTGYIVTGISVYNIGNGYSSGLPPLMSFVRKDIPTGLTRNASGNLLMKTGTTVSMSQWSISTGIAGYTLSQGPSYGTLTMDQNTHYLTVQLLCSGIDATVPISGNITFWTSSTSLVSPFVYSKYFNNNPTFLKKNSNPLVVYTVSTDLSFLLNQNDLDTLYSSAGYTNNNWPFTLGDFDF